MSANQIAVTVLPIPGKRSLDILRRDLKKLSICNKVAADHVAAELFDRLVEIKSIEESQSCVPFKVCKALKKTVSDYLFDDAIILTKSGQVPYIRFVKCDSLFPHCSFA